MCRKAWNFQNRYHYEGYWSGRKRNKKIRSCTATNENNFLFAPEAFASDKSILSDAEASFKNQNLKGAFYYA